MFVSRLFEGWPIRKVYLETDALALPTFASAIGKLMIEEARLSEFYFAEGMYIDKVICSISRDAWRVQPVIATAAW